MKIHLQETETLSKQKTVNLLSFATNQNGESNSNLS